MIPDATAGNRSIYQYKKSENIIFIDIEKQLWTKLIMEKRKQTATSLEQYVQAQTTTPADTSSATSETLPPSVQEPQAPQQ
jgi:hypothetical protein